MVMVLRLSGFRGPNWSHVRKLTAGVFRKPGFMWFCGLGFRVPSWTMVMVLWLVGFLGANSISNLMVMVLRLRV